MGHTKPEIIKDLACELASIRTFPGIIEKKPGVFYHKSIPFMHFHDKDGDRWADVKTVSGNWQKIDVPFSAGVGARREFLRLVKKLHEEIVGRKAIHKGAPR